MNILFFYPSNRRTIPIDIPLRKLSERGHNIFLLTTVGFGPLHDLYRSFGAKVYDVDCRLKGSLIRYLRNLFILVKFCRNNRIDVVHSHLQQANVIAVVARFFVKARIVIFRHHCKFHFLLNETNLSVPLRERIADWIINRLSRKLIVPASAVRKVMIDLEHVPSRKITIIPYIYDFESMGKVDGLFINNLKDDFSCRLRIVMVSRLTPFKRHIAALKSIISLVKKGYDIKVLIMDQGPEGEKIKAFIEKEGQESRIHLLGFHSNILDFISAADVILHPSLTEASNSAIKEAAFLEKIVIACDGVGDFNDYIDHGVDGFLLSPDNFTREAEALLKDIYNNKSAYLEMGKKLKGKVKERFKLTDRVVDMYEAI